MTTSRTPARDRAVHGRRARRRRRAPRRPAPPASTRRAAAGSRVRGPRPRTDARSRPRSRPSKAVGWVARRDGAVVGYLIGQREEHGHVGRERVGRGGGPCRDASPRSSASSTRSLPRPGSLRAGRTTTSSCPRPTTTSSTRGSASTSGSSTSTRSARRPARPSAWCRGASSSSAARPRDDLDALADLELVLPAHMRLSPVFSQLPAQTFEEARAELEADFDNPDYTYFVAEHEGEVVGSRDRLRARRSRPSYAGPESPGGAGFLGFAAVLPGRPRARRRARAGESGARLGARRGLPVGRDGLALHEPRGRSNVAEPRLPPDLPAAHRLIG